MKESSKISNKQIRALTVSIMIGVGILTLPSRIAKVNGNDGWIPILLAGLLVIPIIIVIDRLFNLYPGKSFFEIGRTVLGKWIFNFFLIIFFVYLVVLMASLSRNLAELVKAFLLETTPIEVLILTFILATSYICRESVQIIGRAAYHIYPIILVLIIFLIITSLPAVDLTNTLPAFQSNMKNIPKGIGISFFSYLGYEILLFALPSSENRKENLKYSLTGVGIVIVIYIVFFILSLSHYGLKSLEIQTYPTLSLIKEIDLPGFFIENLDGLAMAVWVLIIFISMASTYFSAGNMLAGLWETKNHDFFILPILPIVFIVSLIPQNPIEIDQMLGKYINYLGITSVVILPFLLYGVGVVRLRRKSK